MIIQGAIALVTGASSGIGRATAESLAAKGAHVIVHGRDAAALDSVAERIDATAISADLARPDEAARLAEAALAVRGRVDVLVANAGIGWSGQFTAMRPAEIDQLVEVNLAAAMRLTHALLPGMIEHDHGFLAYVTSIAGRTGVAGESVYAATKAGLDAFAESLRLELHGCGVNVGVLVPGVVATRFFERRGRPYARSHPKPLAAKPVGARLARMIESGEAEVYRPAWLRLPVAVRGALPGAYRALAGRFGRS